MNAVTSPSSPAGARSHDSSIEPSGIGASRHVARAAAGSYDAGMEEMYLPTPAEIRAACRVIQAGWSTRERERRRGWFADHRHGPWQSPQWTPPRIDLAPDVAAALEVR